MTSLSKEAIRQAARNLYDAEQRRVQIQALTSQYPDISMDEAYAVQSAGIGLKLDAGDRRIGYKIGLTSRVMQRSMKIDSPDYGVLLASMELPDGGTIETARFTDPRIEVELAFVLKDRLFGENLRVTDVLNATDYIVPALELISARSFRVDPDSGYVRKIQDTIADNAANAGIIMGGNPIRPGATDLRRVGGILYRNAEIEETGLAAAVLNHPANGICWIAKRFAPHGVALEPGDILLSGSFTAPVKVQAGDSIVVDYGDLGTVSCHFS